ncbi:MAG TPA: hypothetical protein VMY88_10825, partial [Acidimicrobiales bacterium]|nr:hypothetical protein [Acidimicrobiales bacterium]
CVKDAMVQHWDPDAPNPGADLPGCWRMIQQGLRYLPREWPGGNINAQRGGPEPCNRYNKTAP